MAAGPTDVLACYHDRDPRGARRDGVARVTWHEDGRLRQEETTTPTALVLDISRRLGGEVPQLSVDRPTLEDTYLRLVGDVGDAV